MTTPSADLPHSDKVIRYYHTAESKLGYDLLLGGTKHFGWYEPGQSRWEFITAMRQMEDKLAGWLELPAGARVLDAGCGVGDVACRLADLHGLEVTGIDLLDFNIDEAHKRAGARGLAGRTTFLCGDYTALDLEAGSFDGAYTMETLVHVADVEQALASLHRALRPGGRLVLIEYAHSPYDQVPEDAAAALRQVNDLAAMPAFDRFEDGVLAELMSDAGFVDVDLIDVTGRMLPMLSAFNTLARGPYALGRMLGLSEHMVNAMSAVEFWKHRGTWSYIIHTARKADA